MASVHTDRLFGDDAVTINCNRPQGIRSDTVSTWLLNGSEVDISSSQKYSVTTDGTQLTVRDISYSDEGNYTCRFVQDSELFLSLGDVLRIVGKFFQSQLVEWEI